MGWFTFASRGLLDCDPCSAPRPPGTRGPAPPSERVGADATLDRLPNFGFPLVPGVALLPTFCCSVFHGVPFSAGVTSCSPSHMPTMKNLPLQLIDTLAGTIPVTHRLLHRCHRSTYHSSCLLFARLLRLFQMCFVKSRPRHSPSHHRRSNRFSRDWGLATPCRLALLLHSCFRASIPIDCLPALLVCRGGNIGPCHAFQGASGRLC